MTNFKQKAAIRIGCASLILAIISSVFAWYISKENFEKSIISLAYEESHRLIMHHKSIDQKSDNGETVIQQGVQTLTGGLFDIAEIYDVNGKKLAESLTAEGKKIEDQLPEHVFLNTNKSEYESVTLANGEWVLTVFVPLHSLTETKLNTDLGYLEGVRIVPEWQKKQIFQNSFIVSMLVSLAALLCGMIIYPIVVSLSKENENKTLEILNSHIAMMESLGRAIAKRDSDTGAHNYRVAWIAAKLGEEVGLSGGKMQSLIAGSFLHDVGKIGIPDAILLKPGKLSESEFAVIRTHVQQGEEIVMGMGWLDGANEVVSAHHEKWDGSGYPRALKHEEIPLSARIFAIADVFDALSSKRPYKEPMPYEKVMDILKKDTGSHFDATLMRLFVPMSKGISEKLNGLNEDKVRELLEERVRQHFYT
ncbi:metal dependent phosphohydrolase [Psychromonas ingrahamii 37]|uniref:Metal dependent phosphohydrolase n=1 Tax=Psychromonas ingrahamii (strain DSM 17664 / CCUG 51855 / 37) TaxID=357804 RepID=A1SYY8_PSYIN|nr:HD domain-containing phosphohydrolase [Psychromonas ingrahamii]ABM04703.1 metal dependent phosphohydrolase [Psychromonas ingrahamii 37]